MNAGGFAAIFTPTCSCQREVRTVNSAKAKGEHYIAHAHIIKMTPRLDGPDSADVLVAFNQGRGGLVDRHGHQVASTPAARHIQEDFALEKRGGRWVISAIDVV
jgi:hypothetical protein